MDDQDKEYMAGFNFGYELEKTLRDTKAPKKDKELLRTIDKTFGKIQGKSDRLDGIKEGRKVFIKERQLQQQKENQKKRDKGLER